MGKNEYKILNVISTKMASILKTKLHRANVMAFDPLGCGGCGGLITSLGVVLTLPYTNTSTAILQHFRFFSTTPRLPFCKTSFFQESTSPTLNAVRGNHIRFFTQ